MHIPSTKTFVLGGSKEIATLLVLITFVMVLLVETVSAAFKIDAVQKLHQNCVSVLGKSSTVGLIEDCKTSIK
jgi:hypothetical protein